MKHLNQICRGSVVLTVLLLVLLGFARPVGAARTDIEENKVLKVAYCPLDNFFDYDAQGKEIGYGVELLDKISQYTGIDFQYVYTDSWEDTKTMLLDGEADIRMPGTMPSTPSTTLSYSDTSILDTYEVMLALDTREDLYYQDYDTIRTLKIAITTSFYQAEEVEAYLNDIGVTKEQLVFFDEYNDCYDKLESGEVDALITNIMDMDSDMKMLARFNSVSNYISMTLDNPELRVINEAITQIKLDEPMFLSNLYTKWFPERTTIPLTKEESVYLASLDTLTFAFQPNEGYLSHSNNGDYYGVYVEQAKLICEKLGVDFKAVSIPDCLEGTDHTDAYAGFFYDQNYAKEWEFAISAPIRDINYYIIQKKEKNYDPDNCTIAAIKKFKYTSDYLQAQYKKANFIYFDSYEECLKAVEDGTADMTIINNYIAEYYLGMYQFGDLSVKLSTDYSHMFCFATSENNEMLASILSKGLSMISDEEMTQTYLKGQEDKPESNYLQALYYKKPVMVNAMIVVATVILVGILMLFLFAKKSQKQNRILEDALTTKDHFLSRMSHDMRTPLNVIIGMERIASENENPKDTAHCLDKIRIASEFLLGLINDILDIERMDNGKIKIHLAPYSGEEFHQYIDAVITPLCKEKNIAFSYTYSSPAPFTIMQDRLRINQIYFNLLSNAVKFTPAGGRIEFHTDIEEIADHTIAMRSRITDNGIGMSEAFQKHLFEPFSQEEQTITPAGTGTGLGLAIVKQMCDRMGMEISVSSKLGEGTTFIIYGKFERAKESQIQAYAQQDMNQAADDEVLREKTILVCEDHPLNQEIIKRILEKKQMRVIVAANGKEGLDLFAQSKENSIQAILMDMRMPVMNGIEATTGIRSLDREDAARIPIIALTANAYEEDIKRCIDAGMNEHLAKPINPQLLFGVLTKYFEQNI